MLNVVICGKCGRTEEHNKAKAQGWLIAQMVGKPGYMIIRCPEHITDYARRLAGLRQEYYHQKKAEKGETHS